MKKITNRDILNFEFIDRYHEQAAFKKYILDSDNKLLWIKGKRGIGKTSFINHVVKHIDKPYILINNKIESSKENLLEPFLYNIQEVCQYGFNEYIKKNYKEFFHIFLENTTSKIEESNLIISTVVNFLLEGNNKFNNYLNNNNAYNPYTVICKYIDSIIEKKPLLIIFDNFTRTDIKSVNIILDIIRNYIGNNSANIRFCIITTLDDVTEIDNEVNKLLYRTIPFNELIIEKFNNPIWFMEILGSKFDNTLLDKRNIEYIYNKCDGIPEHLVILLQNIIADPQSLFNNGYFGCGKDKFNALLKSKPITLDIKNLSNLKQIFLFLVVCIGKPIDIFLLKKIMDFLSSTIYLFNLLKDTKFNDVINELIDSKILKWSENNTLIFDHDSLYIDVKSNLQSSPLAPQIYSKLYEYFTANENIIIDTYGYNAEEIEALIIDYAYFSKIPTWENLNINYGIKLYNKGFYNKSSIIFDRVFNFIVAPDFDDKIRYIIADTFFLDGRYQRAYEILECIISDTFNDNGILLYKYYFLLGKCQNILGEKQNALDNFKLALKHIEKDSFYYVRLLDLIHLTLTEIPGKFDKAKEIFIYIKENYEKKEPLAWAKVMKGCCNFYKSKDSLELLNKALEIDIQFKDDFEIAYVKNSIGFVYLRNGDIKKAESIFDEAKDILLKKDIHESVYPMNNLAICYMLNERYEDAIQCLLGALLWSSTPYSYYTINCHLLICYAYTNAKNRTEKILEMLESYIKHPDKFDNVVLRKVYMTLGYAHKILGNTIQSGVFFKMAEPYVQNTSSSYRYMKEMHKNNPDLLKYNNNKYYTDKFEPWVLIHAH